MAVIHPDWIFVHLHKAAGSAVSQVLSQEPGARLVKHPQEKHRPLAGYNVPESTRVLGLVRNPWDRYVSYYHMLCTGTTYNWKLSVYKRAPFEKFLTNHNIEPGLARTRTYHEWFGYRLEEIRRYEDGVPEALRSWGFDRPVPHVYTAGSTKRTQPYQELYTPALRDLVAEWNAIDIARWGYSFEENTCAGCTAKNGTAGTGVSSTQSTTPRTG